VRAGDLERGIEQYRRALRVDPLRKELHQKLSECLWRAGRRDEALRQYRVCRDLLRHELGIGPLPETERLVERVRSGPAG
jgi:DNA-binding SARP family transcriptional activator